MRVFLDVPGQCSEESEWQCLDKKSCIDKRRRCDGYGDCADLSDEDQQLCSNGIFVSLVLQSIIKYYFTKLKNHRESFKFAVDCLEWQFQCADRKRCIDKRRRCDGYNDCLDNSDELQCKGM